MVKKAMTVNRKQQIESELKILAPKYLEVLDESHMHNVPEGAQSHFRVTIVSDQFDELSLVQRHRLVNEQLQELLDNGIHALALHTYTQQQWQDKGHVTPASPDCKGGSLHDKKSSMTQDKQKGS